MFKVHLNPLLHCQFQNKAEADVTVRPSVKQPEKPQESEQAAGWQGRERIARQYLLLTAIQSLKIMPAQEFLLCKEHSQ